MLNNKGFAVSTVLYTLLIAFLMFLGAALAMFSSSSSLIGKANDDLINGTNFEAMQVKPEGACTVEGENKIPWYKIKKAGEDPKISNTIVKIKTRYGTMYWPRDFKAGTTQIKIQDGDRPMINSFDEEKSYNGKITIKPAVVPHPSIGENVLILRITDGTSQAKYSNIVLHDGNDDGEAEEYMGVYDVCK